MDNEKSNPLCLSLSRLMLINRRMGGKNIINELFSSTKLDLRYVDARNGTFRENILIACYFRRIITAAVPSCLLVALYARVFPSFGGGGGREITVDT